MTYDCELVFFAVIFRGFNFNMDSILSVPFLTPFTRYSEWKLKMISSLKKQGLYEVSIGLGKKYYEDEND